MSYLGALDWSFPVTVEYGPEWLGEITDICAGSGIARPLIVTDRKSAGLEHIEHLNAGGVASAVYSEISPNPRDHKIAAGRMQFREGQHDGIIAISGRSGMDGGKAMRDSAAGTNARAPSIAGVETVIVEALTTGR